MDEPIQLPIDGVLDLHTFQPREIKDLVPDYLAACQERPVIKIIVKCFGRIEKRRGLIRHTTCIIDENGTQVYGF